MPELRWILIVLGLVLLAGLWWWETRRRSRTAAEQQEPDAEAPSGRREPSLDGSTEGEDEPGDASSSNFDDLPPIRASRRERSSITRNPPVVEIPDEPDPEDDPEPDTEPEREPPEEDEFVPPDVPYRSMQEKLDELPEDLRNLPRDERAEAEQRQPWVRTQPLDRNEVMGQARQAGDADDEASASQQPQEPEPPLADAARQRIVALRLICNEGRWPGREVTDALQAEGLSFGKYSIFHRERDDGKSIFFVASMVEPGSFDLDAADSQSYPGISVFAVIPGPVEAPATFDMMLATARRLADRIGGHLQDEQGSTLTAQRILSLREELVHFEHVSRRLRKR
jgi:cell division protein ZipA